MGKRKEHHYIPQFYLRNFATNIEKTTIGLHDTVNDFTFFTASIKGQAKEKLFYGDDDRVEASLGTLEATIAPMMRFMITNDKLFGFTPKLYSHFLYYLLVQYTRTVKAEKNTNEQLNSLREKTNEKMGDSPDKIPQQKTSVLEIMQLASSSLPLLQYLDCVLIVNDSPIPFITSDNPVVQYNSLMEEKKCMFPGNSWVSKGLQVFFPISPRHLLYWFDTFVYNCGSKKVKTVYRTDNLHDIQQLNCLQYMNCNRQLFFNAAFSNEQLKKIYNTCFYRKRNQKSKVISAGSFTFVVGEDPRIGLNLSFVKLNKYGKFYRPDNWVVQFRHPILSEIRDKIRNKGS